MVDPVGRAGNAPVAAPAASAAGRRPAPAGISASQERQEGRGICKTGASFVLWSLKGSYNFLKSIVCCCFKRESAAVRQVRKEIRALNTLSKDELKAKVETFKLYEKIGTREWKEKHIAEAKTPFARKLVGFREVVPGVPYYNTQEALGKAYFENNPKVAISYIRAALEGRIRRLQAQERARTTA